MTLTRITLLLTGFLLVSGCTRFNNLEYTPFVRDLDGLSELAITTYAADFPDRLSEKGDVFEEYETAKELYFQVHIRDRKKKFGPNPHVQSIEIHSFTYRIDDGAPVTLLSSYEDNFWMQGNPRYEARELPAIPFVRDGKVTIAIRLTLNGETYAFEGDMPASEKTSLWPTVIVEQGV